MDPDAFLPRFTFFFDISISFFEEVAKFRAGRRIWAKIARDRLGARDPRAWRFKFHGQTSGVDLTRQQPLNNIARVTAQARGGQILVTAIVADAARSSGISLTPLGPVSLRNVREAVELFALGLAPEAHEVIDPVCRMRVTPENAAGRFRIEGADYWFCSLDCVRSFTAAPDAYRRPGG